MKYLATYYKVTNDEIMPTGKTEVYIQPTRDEAVLNALYIHRLHNGRAWASNNGVIRCPSCGQIAVTKITEQEDEIRQGKET